MTFFEETLKTQNLSSFTFTYIQNVFFKQRINEYLFENQVRVEHQAQFDFLGNIDH